MYINVCTYMCTHMYIHVHTCYTHVYIHVHTRYTHTYIHVHTHYIYVYIPLRTHVCTHVCIHINTCSMYLNVCTTFGIWCGNLEGRIHTIHNNTFTRETITAFMEFYYIYNTTFGSLMCREKEYSVVDRLAIIMLSRSCVTRRNHCANSNSNITSIRTLVVNITIYHIKNCYKKYRPCQDLNLESPDS